MAAPKASTGIPRKASGIAVAKKPSATALSKKASVTIQQNPNKQQKDQNDYFITYAYVIIGLLPILPRKEREMVDEWMKKLREANKTEEERNIRNDYIWFLLVQLESNVVTLPFINHPPEGKLLPISKSVNKVVYEELLQAANKRAALIEDAEILKAAQKRPEEKDKDKEKDDEEEEEEELFKIKPEDFLAKQPTPKRGFIVYGSCFSDQRDAPAKGAIS